MLLLSLRSPICVLPVELIMKPQVLVGLTLPAVATFILISVYYLSAVETNDMDMWTGLDVSFLKWLRAKRPKWRTNGGALEKVRFTDVQDRKAPWTYI